MMEHLWDEAPLDLHQTDVLKSVIKKHSAVSTHGCMKARSMIRQAHRIPEKKDEDDVQTGPFARHRINPPDY